MVDPSRS